MSKFTSSKTRSTKAGCYADGGMVRGPGTDGNSVMRLARGGLARDMGEMAVEGAPSRPRGDRKSKGVTVNVIVPKGGDKPMPVPVPVPAGPVGPMPPGPMPMRAAGGRIKNVEDGAGGGLGRLEKARLQRGGK